MPPAGPMQIEAWTGCDFTIQNPRTQLGIAGVLRSLVSETSGKSVARCEGEAACPCRALKAAPSLPNRGDARVRSRSVSSKNLGCRSQRHLSIHARRAA